MQTDAPCVPHYRRPAKRLIGVLNKGLGPLPSGMPDLTQDEDIGWDSVPRYHLVAILVTIGAVIATVLAVWHSVDWTQHSIVSALVSLLPLRESTQGRIVQLIVVLYVAFIVWRLRSKKGTATGNKPSGFLRAAMLEEQWFRSGCESWSWPRRVYSCAYFGAIHLLNYVVPVAAAVALMLGGAVMMGVYLRAYHTTGSTVSATLTSSRFHRDYNETVLFIVLPIAVVGMTIFSIARVF